MSIVERIEYCLKKNSEVSSIKALERKVGLSNGSIRRWDNNSPSVDRVLIVANFLQVPFEWLVTGNVSSEIENSLELDLLKQFRLLNNFEKGKIMGILENMNTDKKENAKFSDLEINELKKA